MRSIDELLSAAKEAQRNYTQSKAKAEQERAELIQAVDQATAAASAALEAGNQEEYILQTNKAAFAAKRAETLQNRVVSPFFTLDQHNAFVAEVDSAHRAELKNVYKKLYELAEKWENAVAELRSISLKVNGTAQALRGTGVPATGIEASKWKSPMSGVVPSVVEKLIDTSLQYEIRQHYNPENKK